MTTFMTIFGTISQLFFISAAAGILVRTKIVSPSQIQALSAVTVNVFLPCLIISKIILTFDPESFPLWWALPLSGLLLVFTGLIFAAVLFRMKKEKWPFLPLASMQNAIYIVLPIVKIIYPDQFDLAAMYCFLLTIGLTPLMWSIGKVLLTGTGEAKIQRRDFITPPFVATIISIVVVFSGFSAV
ncbi:Putative permease (fragment) [Desulfamplus magnetovallimortis]|uniref:Putative permease n=1 Tax=Desulfamplus magnetovallimortis TaxID=1246637 RepID=A0A1W1HI89_9BACT